jgi:lipopolysaccharide/colanic/teichoic acid biosynthesis glycosyltransferase
MNFIARIIAFILLIILSPLLVLISLLCYLFQGGPVFYVHERVGFKFIDIKVYKFRSMKKNDGLVLITDSEDSRVTWFGTFLRRSKLDEVPQLINILNGEMRFVGPRPEVKEFVSGNDFSFLKDVKPGLTDFSSILFRHESEILTKAGGTHKYPELLSLKLKLAHLYSANKGFVIDLILVFATILSIVSQRSANYIVFKLIKSLKSLELIQEVKKWGF